MRFTTVKLTLVIIIVSCGYAKAQFSFPDTYIPVGFTYARLEGKNFFGGEASVVNFSIIDKKMGLGLYGDALFGSSAIKCSIGPELIFGGGSVNNMPIMVGIDSGYTNYQGESGLCMRPFLVIAFVIPYFRYNWYRGRSNVAEFGISAKFPLPIR